MPTPNDCPKPDCWQVWRVELLSSGRGALTVRHCVARIKMLEGFQKNTGLQVLLKLQEWIAGWEAKEWESMLVDEYVKNRLSCVIASWGKTEEDLDLEAMRKAEEGWKHKAPPTDAEVLAGIDCMPNPDDEDTVVLDLSERSRYAEQLKLIDNSPNPSDDEIVDPPYDIPLEEREKLEW